MFKGLKAVFYDDSDSPPPAVQQAAAPVASAPLISNQPSSPPPTHTSEETKRIDQALQEKILSAINAAPLGGYRMFESYVESLEDAIPDTGTRYKKALEFCAKQGHTGLSLLNDIDKAIGVLEDEARVFEADQKTQFQASVGALTQSVEILTAKIASKTQQAEQLRQEIATLTQKRDTDQAAISTEQAQIDHVGGRFNLIYQAAMREVQDHRAAVEQRAKVQS